MNAKKVRKKALQNPIVTVRLRSRLQRYVGDFYLVRIQDCSDAQSDISAISSARKIIKNNANKN